MKQIVLASSNLGKLAEFRTLFSGTEFDFVPQTDFSFSEAEETGLTFVENAIIKARNACQYSGLPALADDSGLEVEVLQGKPGIYSARYAGKNASQKEHTNKLLQALDGIEEKARLARFYCVLVFLKHAGDPAPIISQGRWEGRILTKAIGEEGFGYDPIFFVPEQQCSAAQLSSNQKSQLSHRSKAAKEMLKRLSFEYK